MKTLLNFFKWGLAAAVVAVAVAACALNGENGADTGQTGTSAGERETAAASTGGESKAPGEPTSAGDESAPSDEPAAAGAELLALWQERLEAPEWNGFVTQMYSDVRRLSLRELLYNGAGISRRMTVAEKKAYEEVYGWPDTDSFAFDRETLEAYLEAHTGFGSADFAGGLGELELLEGFDGAYLVHGDTNYTGVEVLEGTATGDTLSLEVQSGATGDDCGTLTIRDGKVVSFTNDLYNEVERLAWEWVERVASAVDEQGPGRVTNRAVQLYRFDGDPAESGGGTRYLLEYRLCLDGTVDGQVEVDVDGRTVTLTGWGGTWIAGDSAEGELLEIVVDADGEPALEGI